MLPDQTKVDGFIEFVATNERKLRHALTAALGFEAGREAAAEALAYGWERWERVGSMTNPVGYLYVVGRRKGRGLVSSSRIAFPPIPDDCTPWFEPGLPAALGSSPSGRWMAIHLFNRTVEPGGFSKPSCPRWARVPPTIGLSVDLPF